MKIMHPTMFNNTSSTTVNTSLDSKGKALIDPSVFLDSGRIEGQVLYSTFPIKLSPWFLTGFIEAEGSFNILIFANPKALAKTSIKFRFIIAANYKDIVMLCAIRNYFNNGSISTIRKDTGVVLLEISSIEVIKNVIIPFLDNFPLKGTKYFDYLTWKNSFNDFLENRDSLDAKLLLIERLKEAKANLNRNKQEIKLPMEHLEVIDPNYISGFISGDGCVSVVTGPASFHEGFGRATLVITQHVHNKLLLEAIMNYFSVGTLTSVKSRPFEVNYVVSNKEDINNTIIPFFEKYPFYGLHSISFLKWSHIVRYLLKIREDKSIFNRLNKDTIISNVRTVWLDKSILLYNNLTIESKELCNKITDLFNPPL